MNDQTASADLIDLAAERDRLQKEVQKVSGFIDGSRKKLSNEGFVKNAPANVVDGIRESLAGHEANLSNLKRMLDELS